MWECVQKDDERTQDFDIVDNGAHVVKEEMTELLNDWDQIEMFVMWEYSNRHLKIEDKDVCHCCTCALGGICGNIHENRTCNTCSECLTFFDIKVKKYLLHVRDLIENESERNELNTMITSTHNVQVYVVRWKCTWIKML